MERNGTAGGMKRVLPAKVEEGLQCAVEWFLGSGAGQAAQTERSGVRRLWCWVCRVGYEQRRKESQHGCSSATCGEWEPLRMWVDS